MHQSQTLRGTFAPSFIASHHRNETNSYQANCPDPPCKLRILNQLFTIALADLPRPEGCLTGSESRRLFRRPSRCDHSSDYGGEYGNNPRSLYRNDYRNVLRTLNRSDCESGSGADYLCLSRRDHGNDSGNDYGDAPRSLYRNGYTNLLRSLYRSDYNGGYDAERRALLLTIMMAQTSRY